MARRLTRITTRTGDQGTSGLADGSRLAKSDPAFEALGSVDELNSALGAVIALLPDAHALRPALLDVQSRLFDLGGALALPGVPHALTTAIARIEALISEHNAALPHLREFVLPGGATTAAQMHVARAAARRAERMVWALLEARSGDYDVSLGVYLNRLSDLCFVLARVLNREAGVPEILWQRDEV